MMRATNRLLGALLIGLGTAPVYAQSLAPAAGRIAPIIDGVAPVTLKNTWPDPATGTLMVGLTPDPTRLAQPVVNPSSADPAMGMLRRLYARGRAAGLATTLYDNRDRGHSPLPPDLFPQLSHTQYGPKLMKQNLDYNWAGDILYPMPVIGNSSTARVSGPMARSVGRIAIGGQKLANQSFQLYVRNQIYVYPEHRDHDPETGDRFFANTPYFLMSQGSSYSDKPFVEALALILASYTPDTRARLDQDGLLAPVTQMVFRRSLTGIRSVDDYLSPRAHPVVFDKSRLRPEAMVSLANSIASDAIPPMVRLRVLAEFPSVPGQDYLAENVSEVVFTTPSAIARAWRSFAFSRTMTLSAADTADPNGRPLTFHWVVLQGDPDRIQITPRAGGEVADIRVAWQATTPSATVTGLTATRIDVGVFADNGVWISAPAILSISFPAFQNRVYEEQGGDVPALVSLDYMVDGDDSYADPSIWPMADWTDQIRYDSGGRISQIARTYPGGEGDTLIKGMTGYIKNQTFGVPLRVSHRFVRQADGQLRLEMVSEE